MEQWKYVKGFEGIYHVSSCGRVRSLDRAKKRDFSGRRVDGRIMTASLNKKGYLTVHLSKDTKERRIPVHRLVAQAFIPNPDAKEQVNHIDGDKQNNNVGNLEWVTNEENMAHAIAHGLINISPMLDASHRIKSWEAATAACKKKVIRSDGVIFDSVKEAAESIGVAHGAVSMNINGKTKFCQGYKFSYYK